MNEDRQPSPQGHTFTSRVIFGEKRVPGMASWLVKRTVIRNVSQARRIIVGLIVFDFAAAIIITCIFTLR